jgi:hypothetical protein
VARRGLCHRGIVGLMRQTEGGVTEQMRRNARPVQLLQLIDLDDRDWLIARKACCVAQQSIPISSHSIAKQARPSFCLSRCWRTRIAVTVPMNRNYKPVLQLVL